MTSGRSSRDWRQLVAQSVFVCAVTVFCIVEHLTILSIICAVGAPALAFVAGYLLRADQQSAGVISRIWFLRTSEDVDRGRGAEAGREQ
jgi:hypothetical protein